MSTRFRTGAATRSGLHRLMPLLALLLTLAGWPLAMRPAHAGTPAIQLDSSELVEYWYWAGGVLVSGSGFAPTSPVTVTGTDPLGGTRHFAATTDATGTFSVRINAMKIRSVLGQHVIAATDSQNNTAQAPLRIIRNPDEVLAVTTSPAELPLAQFAATGTRIRVSGLTPNGRLSLHLGDPADNIGELMMTAPNVGTPLFADADGRFELHLDPDTPIWGSGVGGVVPTEGVWTLSAHDMSGNNQHQGSFQFRMLPDNPSPDSYCSVTATQEVEPITRVVFAGIDNASPLNSLAGYENFTAIHGEATAGRTYAIRLQGKAALSFNANTYTVFFDWNRNGTLDEPQEIYSSGHLIGSTGIDGMEVVHDVAIPADAGPGPVRMRVLKVYSPSSFALYWPSGACGNYRWGQIEDYTVDIVRSDRVFADGFDPAVAAPTLAKAFSPATVATNTPTRLTITLTNANATAATLTGDLLDAFPSGLVSAASASTTCTGGPGILQTGTSVGLQAGAVIPANGSCTIGVDVAAVTAGTLTNTIPTGGLVTDAGNNAAAATATLTALAPTVAPTVTKSFAAPSVATNTPIRLTITLANTNATAATLTGDLVDAFPSGLVSAASASTTCSGGPGISQTGTSVTLLTGAVIPANGSCTIGVDVAAVTAGTLTNTIPAGGLVTDAGSNASAATATLTATTP